MKPLVKMIATLLISNQLIGCSADLIGGASSVIGIAQFSFDMYTKYMVAHNEETENDRHNGVIWSISDLSSSILNDTKVIIDHLDAMYENIRHVLKEEVLEQHFAKIMHAFDRALHIKEFVDNGIIFKNNSEYEDFSRKRDDIDLSIDEITRILTDGDLKFALKQKFLSNLQKYESVCKSGMSHLQLLDSLLGNIKYAYGQHYWTRKLMYDFLELTDRQDNTVPKEVLLHETRQNYAKVVKVFKSVMNNASNELWKCDPPRYNDGIRFTDETDPDFSELRAFSKYLLNQDVFSNHISCRDYPCEKVTKLDGCGNGDSNFCEKSRPCKGNLTNCNYGTNRNDRKLNVCINQNKNARHRYLAISTNWAPDYPEDPNYRCDKGEKKLISTLKPGPGGGYGYVSYNCDYCDCICEENYFYVDTESPYFEEKSRLVVTGARLIMENNTLRIQVEQATLLANGAIENKFWKPTETINEATRIRISWNELRRVRLAPLHIEKNNFVVVGLSFHLRYDNSLHLMVHSRIFNYETGFERNILRAETYSDDIEWKKYDNSRRNVPTKSKIKNTPDSTDDQYVEFTITDALVDGGQSVIPFIDTQKLSANGPLSGAQLYIRGQPGFGGFLAIKLFTFDFRGLIRDEDPLHIDNTGKDVGQFRSLLIENFHKLETGKTD